MSIEQIFLNNDIGLREQLEMFNSMRAVKQVKKGVETLEQSDDFVAKYYGIENEKGGIDSYIAYSYYDGTERNDGIRYKEGEIFTSLSETSYFGGKPTYNGFSINEHSGVMSRINSQDVAELYDGTVNMLNSYEDTLNQMQQGLVQE